MSAANVYPLSEETIRRSLFGRPTRRGYRAAVASVIRNVKAAKNLSNEGLADSIGCHEDTIKNAENEAGSLDPVTLLNIAYAFGEQAIAPVRELYLCKPAEPLSPHERVRAAQREIDAALAEMEGVE